MSLTIEVSKREGKIENEHIPAVVYGPKQESISLSVRKKDFDKLFAEAGESSIVTLKGLGEPVEVLIHDVTFAPIKGGITHIDFYAIERGKELTTDVPLEFVGTAPAEKLGGVLTKALHEVEITCRPSKLPKEIVVDVSIIEELDKPIRVKDLILPDGVKIENEAEEVVAIVVPVEEEKEEVATVDMSAIEVEKKGKEETEAK